MKKFAVISLVLLAVAPAAMADINVIYDMNKAAFNYVSGSQALTVTETVDSIFDVAKVDTVSLATLDTARLFNNSFDLALNLNLVDLAGANNWGGTGTLKFTDINTGTNAVEAFVNLTDVQIVSGNLEIHGLMSDLGANTSLLVNRGDPWVFVGNSGAAGQDAVAGQITVANVATFDNGTLLTLRFGVGNITLDSLFGMDRTFTDGEVKGSVVPAPAAVLLGTMGLGLVGWVKRRFA